MRNRFKGVLLLLAAIGLLYAIPSCKKDELKAPVPAYLYIPKIDLATIPALQGAPAHGIADAWVYVGNDFLGVFELPARVPVIPLGQQVITIIPGVRKSGSASFHIPYPFYSNFMDTLVLKPQQMDTLHPVVTYRDNVKFAWLEDFEDQSSSLQASGNNGVDSAHFKIINDPDKVYAPGPGSLWSVEADMGTGYNIFEYSTKDLYTLPRDRDVYLEVNYNANVPVQFGFYSITTQQLITIPEVLTFPTNGEWKKMYISLREDLVVQPANAQFRIFAGALNNSNDLNARIYLDNFKLVYFE